MSSPLEIERRALAKADHDLYDPENFPGSPAWMAWKRAEQALNKFDAAHPEIREAIRARSRAADQAAYDGLSDFVKGGS